MQRGIPIQKRPEPFPAVALLRMPFPICSQHFCAALCEQISRKYPMPGTKTSAGMRLLGMGWYVLMASSREVLALLKGTWIMQVQPRIWRLQMTRRPPANASLG